MEHSFVEEEGERLKKIGHHSPCVPRFLPEHWDWYLTQVGQDFAVGWQLGADGPCRLVLLDC